MKLTSLSALIERLFSPPTNEDVRRAYVATGNCTIARVILLVVSPGLAFSIVLYPRLAVAFAMIVVCLDIIAVLLLYLTRVGHESAAGVFAILSFWVLFMTISWLSGGLSSPSIVALVIVVLLSSLVHGAWWGAISTGLVVVSLFALAWAETRGLVPPSAIAYTPWLKAIAYGIYFAGLGVLQYVLDRGSRRVLEQASLEAGGRLDAERRLANTIEHAPFAAAICELTEDGGDFVIVHVNNPMRFAPYIGAAGIIGRRLSEIYPAFNRGEIGARLVETALGGAAFELSAVPFEGAQGERALDVRFVQVSARTVALFITDVTERHQAHAAMRHMAFHDQLTGLANRKTLVDRLTAALANRERRSDNIALLFIDLDNFKTVNDVYGHAIGDALLMGVAERLSSIARADDTVARLGGDEFTVLVAEATGVDDIKAVVQRIADVFSAPFEIEGAEIPLTASIGVAAAASGEVDANAILDRADLAMYRVKRAGRNGYHFSAEDSPEEAVV